MAIIWQPQIIDITKRNRIRIVQQNSFKMNFWRKNSSLETIQSCIRRYSSRKEKLIEYYATIKQLVGPIIPKDKNYTKEEVEQLTKECPRKTNNKKSGTDISSELYWLTSRAVDHKHVRVFRRNDSKGSEVDSSKRDSIKSIDENGSLATRIESRPIPFSESDLQKMLSHPLKVPKATSDCISEALGSSKAWPSISKVLTATMSESARYSLKKWKLEKIAELGEEGFKQYERQTLETGKLFHSSVERYLEKREKPDNDSPIIQLWRSVNNVLIEMNPQAILIESSIIHPHLKYKGIIDGLAVIK